VRPLVEFAIVVGLCSFAAFYLIPAQTTEGSNFGLSPRMVPIVCCAVIALLATVSLVQSLIVGRVVTAAPGNAGLITVVLLSIASLLATILVHWLGLVLGGIGVVLLASAILGERRLSAFLVLGSCAGALLVFVKWSGL